MANINSSDWLTAIGQSKFTRFFSLWTMVTLEEQMEDLDAGLRRKSCHQNLKIGDETQMVQIKPIYEIGYLSLFKWKVHQVTSSRDQIW